MNDTLPPVPAAAAGPRAGCREIPVPGARLRTLLWCVVAALGIGTLGEAWRAVEARADVAAWGGDFAALTTDIGSEDLVVVLDQRAEQLLLYRVRNQNAIEFAGRQSVADLFLEARRSAGR